MTCLNKDGESIAARNIVRKFASLKNSEGKVIPSRVFSTAMRNKSACSVDHIRPREQSWIVESELCSLHDTVKVRPIKTYNLRGKTQTANSRGTDRERVECKFPRVANRKNDSLHVGSSPGPVAPYRVGVCAMDALQVKRVRAVEAEFPTSGAGSRPEIQMRNCRDGSPPSRSQFTTAEDVQVEVIFRFTWFSDVKGRVEVVANTLVVIVVVSLYVSSESYG